MARPFLLHAALAAAALALRMPSKDDVDPALLPAEVDELESVPTIEDYWRLWTQRYTGEVHLKDPMPASIQLVLGLFTVAPDFEYRMVVRETWLKQTGVCYWRRQPRPGCSVYVAFVIGKNQPLARWRSGNNMTAEEVEATHREEGMLVVDTPENMNGNKSEVWFDTAGRLFPWATHVGKTDMDTYPLLHKLVHRMEAGRGCSRRQSPYEVIGRPHDTASFGPRFEHVCGGFGDMSCPQFSGFADRGPVAKLGQPWRFLSGELYVLSMPLVQQVNWTVKGYGTEDLQVTQHVAAAAEKKGFCVVLRRLDAWYHRTSHSSLNYTNDL